MLLGAWGKAGSIGSGTAGGAPMNPTTPVVPSSGEPFPSLQRRRTRLRYIVLIVTFALYLILGASTFSSIEAPAIEAISSNVLQLREKFLGRHPHLKGECDWTVVGVRGWWLVVLFYYYYYFCYYRGGQYYIVCLNAEAFGFFSGN